MNEFDRETNKKQQSRIFDLGLENKELKERLKALEFHKQGLERTYLADANRIKELEENNAELVRIIGEYPSALDLDEKEDAYKKKIKELEEHLDDVRGGFQRQGIEIIELEEKLGLDKVPEGEEILLESYQVVCSVCGCTTFKLKSKLRRGKCDGLFQTNQFQSICEDCEAESPLSKHSVDENLGLRKEVKEQ